MLLQFFNGMSLYSPSSIISTWSGWVHNNVKIVLKPHELAAKANGKNSVTGSTSFTTVQYWLRPYKKAPLTIVFHWTKQRGLKGDCSHPLSILSMGIFSSSLQYLRGQYLITRWKHSNLSTKSCGESSFSIKFPFHILLVGLTNLLCHPHSRCQVNALCSLGCERPVVSKQLKISKRFSIDFWSVTVAYYVVQWYLIKCWWIELGIKFNQGKIFINYSFLQKMIRLI